MENAAQNGHRAEDRERRKFCSFYQAAISKATSYTVYCAGWTGFWVDASAPSGSVSACSTNKLGDSVQLDGGDEDETEIHKTVGEQLFFAGGYTIDRRGREALTLTSVCNLRALAIHEGFLATMERPEICEDKRHGDALADKEHFWHKNCVDYLELAPGERGETSASSLLVEEEFGWRGIEGDGGGEFGDAKEFYWKGGALMSGIQRGEANGAVEGGVRVRVFFIKRPPGTPYIQKQLQITLPTLEYLCSHFNVSQTFVESLFENQIWCGSGCFVQRNEDRKIRSFEMFYRGNCGWRDRTQIYYRCDFEKRTVTYLVVNCSEKAIKRITDNDVVKRPFALDALLADECLKAWQDAIIRYRTKLIEYEYHDIDTDNKETLSLATNYLHGLSSNLYRITEHLADFEERMIFLRNVLSTYVGASRQHPGWREDVWKMFHLCSQTDNKISAAMTSTNVEIARLTSAISEETQRDNSAMITLSIVAMLFLPGTFVS
ncbi:hypothetical protein GP486_006406, partial [Trichoglossum hirsutum]